MLPEPCAKRSEPIGVLGAHTLLKRTHRIPCCLNCGPRALPHLYCVTCQGWWEHSPVARLRCVDARERSKRACLLTPALAYARAGVSKAVMQHGRAGVSEAVMQENEATCQSWGEQRCDAEMHWYQACPVALSGPSCEESKAGRPTRLSPGRPSPLQSPPALPRQLGTPTRPCWRLATSAVALGPWGMAEPPVSKAASVPRSG